MIRTEIGFCKLVHMSPLHCTFYSRYYLDTVQGYQATVMFPMSEYVYVILSQNPKHTRAPQACVALCCAIMLSSEAAYIKMTSACSSYFMHENKKKSELILLLLTVPVLLELLELRLSLC